MQSRVAKILGQAIKQWPKNFTFRERLNPLDAGGLDTIEAWLIAHPNRRLVVLDTYGKVRGMKEAREEQYQYDYRLVVRCKSLRRDTASRSCSCTTSARAETPRTSSTRSAARPASPPPPTRQWCSAKPCTVSGSICAVAMSRSRTSRLSLDPETGLWSVTGDYDEAAAAVPGDSLRGKVAELLGGSPIALTPAQVAQRLGEKPATMRVVLHRMARHDPPQVVKDQSGAYALARAPAR